MRRRSFLQHSLASAAAGSLASCSGRRGTRLRLHIWSDYLAPEVARAFEREHNCVLEIETYESNEEMLERLEAGARHDVLVPSSYTVKSLLREGLIRELDHSRLPNGRHIDRDYLTGALDPAMRFSVPYLMAACCLAWRRGGIEDPRPSYSLFDRSELRGKFSLLDDMREVLGAALRSLGYSLNSSEPLELEAARDVAIRWKHQLASFENEGYREGLASGRLKLAQAYAGDLLQLAASGVDLEIEIPEEGTAYTCDDLCIPSDAAEPELAHAFIDFVTRPEQAAANMSAVLYRAPNVAAYDLVPAALRGNQALFPSREVFQYCEVIDHLGSADHLWLRIWDEVRSA